MTSTGDSERLRRRPRRELLLVLLPGLVGAGLILLATRQGWAHVTTAAPRPLPASTVEVTGQNLVPAAGALAVAAVASLAAVLATRAMLRRITGIVLAGLGAGIALAVSVGISAADVLAAAAGAAGPATGSGAGSAAGSATAGGTQGGSAVPLAGPLSGFPGHAVVAALPWRGVAIAGALAIIAAGALTAWRADRLPVMSGRYDRPALAAPAAAPAASGAPAASAAPAASGAAAGAASMWESLSQGEDPTAAEPEHYGGGPERPPNRDASVNSGNTDTPAVAEPGQGAVSTAER